MGCSNTTTQEENLYDDGSPSNYSPEDDTKYKDFEEIGSKYNNE